MQSLVQWLLLMLYVCVMVGTAQTTDVAVQASTKTTDEDEEDEGKKKKEKKSRDEMTPLEVMEDMKDWELHSMLFDSNSFRSFHILMSPRDLKKMDKNPIAEVYYPCSFVADYGNPDTQQLFEGVGCRYKGSVGSLRICLDPKTGRAKSSDVCRKLSWKIDSNKYLFSQSGKKQKQKIWGSKKMVFNGLAVDHSLMSERLAYNLIRDAGMIAPRAVHAKIYVNNEYDGIFSLVEAPDEEFTEDNFRDDANKGKGALYKDALFDRKHGQRYYKKHRESGKNMDEFMAEVSKAVAETKGKNAEEILEKYFDTESIVNVTAFNTVVGMTDDWRKRHNFFWYVREDFPAGTPKEDKKNKTKVNEMEMDRKIVMIPWDYDRINDEMAKKRGVPGAPKNWYDPYDTNSALCSAKDPRPEEYAAAYPIDERDYWIEFFAELPPGLSKPIQCDKFTRLMTRALKKRVKERIKYYAENIITPEIIEMKLTAYATQIQAKVDKDNDPPTSLSEWKQEIKSLYKYLVESRQEALDEIKPRSARGISTSTQATINTILGQPLGASLTATGGMVGGRLPMTTANRQVFG